MKRNLIALAALSACTHVAANLDLPQGAVHQQGWGNAVVQNSCDDPVYYVLDNADKRGTLQPSATFSLPVYTKAADGGGGSIKLFREKDLDLYSTPKRAVTQFEFTPAADQLYVDVSNVNSNNGQGKNGNGEDCNDYPPFMKQGLKFLVPDLGEDIECPPGQNPCKKVYTDDKDDWATTSAPHGKDVKLILCHGSSSGGEQQTSGSEHHDNNDDSNKNKDNNKNEGTDIYGSDVCGNGGGSFRGCKTVDEMCAHIKANGQPLPSECNSSGQNQGSATGQQAPAQPPTTTAPEQKDNKQQPSQTEDDDEEVFTVVHKVQAPAQTVVKYVHANAEDQKAKRQEHVHHHIHNKIHKRRHAA